MDDTKFTLDGTTVKDLDSDYILSLIDDHSKQLVEIVKVLETLTKEMKSNRNLITKSCDVTDAIVKTLNEMNRGRI
tara:strand:+ start:644 stop:871 length:228 start_codon:yes stop_codon:yes gene_type:complete